MITRIVIKGFRIFKDFEWVPNPGMNIVVGDNASGKSSLLEALTLGLTGRINGRWAQDELNPYWFNNEIVKQYFDSLNTDSPLTPPEILIELYLSKEEDDLQYLLGVYNSRQSPEPGIKMTISPNPDYATEFSDYMSDKSRPEILPTEWYNVDWRQFSDERLIRRPKILGVSMIDSRTIKSTTGVDYHTRQMLKEFIDPKESATVAIAHRKASHVISTKTLRSVNERIAVEREQLSDQPIGLYMDQSSSASWEHSIVPHVGDIPFAFAGQGQQAAIKVALAMHRSKESTFLVLIEEPENHLSHTSLTKLIHRIESLAGNRQIFLTTHSSYVLNRLGIDKLVLLHKGGKAQFNDLPEDTVNYFKRLSGYDTLRLVLSEKIVMVEGPSDEMIFESAFCKKHGKRPMDLGVDVISMAGVSLKRGMQLCAALERKAIAIRDNDGKEPDHWRSKIEELLEAETREVFIGDVKYGHTLEPQFSKVNDTEKLRKFFNIQDAQKDLVDWMKGNKTAWALKLVESDNNFSYPQYINDAVDFVS